MSYWSEKSSQPDYMAQMLTLRFALGAGSDKKSVEGSCLRNLVGFRRCRVLGVGLLHSDVPGMQVQISRSGSYILNSKP